MFVRIHIFWWNSVYVKEAMSARHAESLVKKNSFSSRKWKHSWMFMGYSWRTRSGVLAWEAGRPATTLSHSTLPIHFRHSSLILKTMMAMSSARRIVVRSVTVIYTKMFASTWCNADCLFEEHNLNFNRIICHQSSQRCADISLTQHAWSTELVLWYIFFSTVMNAKLVLMSLGRRPTHAEKL